MKSFGKHKSHLAVALEARLQPHRTLLVQPVCRCPDRGSRPASKFTQSRHCSVHQVGTAPRISRFTGAVDPTFCVDLTLLGLTRSGVSDWLRSRNAATSLWSGRYPCRSRIRQSAGSYASRCASATTRWFDRLRPHRPSLAFHSRAPCGALSLAVSSLSPGPFRCSLQSKHCGVLWSARNPCQVSVSDSPPVSFAHPVRSASPSTSTIYSRCRSVSTLHVLFDPHEPSPDRGKKFFPAPVFDLRPAGPGAARPRGADSRRRAEVVSRGRTLADPSAAPGRERCGAEFPPLRRAPDRG